MQLTDFRDRAWHRIITVRFFYFGRNLRVQICFTGLEFRNGKCCIRVRVSDLQDSGVLSSETLNLLLGILAISLYGLPISVIDIVLQLTGKALAEFSNP